MSGNPKRPRMDLAMQLHPPEELSTASHLFEDSPNHLHSSVLEENQRSHRNTPRSVDSATQLLKTLGMRFR